MNFQCLDDEFEFYLRFTKPFVLNKANSEDRAHAVVWIKKLMRECDKLLRLDYLKLLLFALQKPVLIRPFNDLPPSTLKPLPQGHSIFEIMSLLLEECEQEALDFKREPMVSTAVSHDLTEYAAVQTIPNFGVHCFYATSPLSINQWHLSDEFKYPKRYIYGAEAWEQSLSKLYHTDITGNLVKTDKTVENKNDEIKLFLDCKDKPNICKTNDESSDQKTSKELSEPKGKICVIENRGPKSPWNCVEECPPCSHRLNQSGAFTWDKLSRLDSFYNIQPSPDLHEDFVLNDHGLTLFETDQIALLLANKNVQKQSGKDLIFKKVSSVTKSNDPATIPQKSDDVMLEDKDRLEDAKISCTRPRNLYNPHLMNKGYEEMVSCHKKDPHPKKFHIDSNELDDVGNILDEAQYSKTDVETQKPSDVHVTDKEHKHKVQVQSTNHPVNIKNKTDLHCLFDENVPMQNFKTQAEKFNNQKAMKLQDKLDELVRRCSNCCNDVQDAQEARSSVSPDVPTHTKNK